jgi:hypothetical protein
MDSWNKIRPHTIIALVEDKHGVLNRIASKWRQRGFNIESLAVGHPSPAFPHDAGRRADERRAGVKQLDCR